MTEFNTLVNLIIPRYKKISAFIEGLNLDLDYKSTRPSFQLIIGSAIFVIVISAGLFGPYFHPIQPDTMIPATRLVAPNSTYPFGTDPFGRDVLSRTLHGIRIALVMGFSATLMAVIPGVLLGMAAGFLKGWVDRIFSRIIDLLLSLPGLLLALIFIARFGPSLVNTTIILGVLGIPSIYRTIRADTLRVVEEEYISSAIVIGATPIRIMLKHILPNVFATMVTIGALRVGSVILAGSGLSFIGLGAQPPTPELGALLASGRDYFIPYWWLIVFPGITIFLIIFSVQLIGDGLKDQIFNRLNI